MLDAEATIAKAVELLEEAAGDGAQLAVLPETFVPLYPGNAWGQAAAAFGGFDELWERLWENSVEVPGPQLEPLVETCRRHDLVCAIGVNEREAERPGSLYNTVVYLSREGVLHKHRKLMPTMQERLFHGIGAGDDLDPVQTPLGRVGGLLCGETGRRLARYHVYRGGPQIWVPPTAADTAAWLPPMRHVPIESGAVVVAVPQFIPRSAFPGDCPLQLPDAEVYGNGGAAIVEPTWGKVIAGPLYGEEGTVMADCDLRQGLHAKRWFDAVGHYSREDVLGRPEGVAPERQSAATPGEVGARAGDGDGS